MSNALSQSAVISANVAVDGTFTHTMEEGNWEIFKVEGYLTAAASTAADITVSVDAVAVSGAMRVADGTVLATGDADGTTFSWNVVVDTALSLDAGSVITIVNVKAASVTNIHIRRV